MYNDLINIEHSDGLISSPPEESPLANLQLVPNRHGFQFKEAEALAPFILDISHRISSLRGIVFGRIPGKLTLTMVVEKDFRGRVEGGVFKGLSEASIKNHLHEKCRESGVVPPGIYIRKIDDTSEDWVSDILEQERNPDTTPTEGPYGDFIDIIREWSNEIEAFGFLVLNQGKAVEAPKTSPGRIMRLVNRLNPRSHS